MSHNSRERSPYTFSTLDGCVIMATSCTDGRAKTLTHSLSRTLGQEVRAMVLSW